MNLKYSQIHEQGSLRNITWDMENDNFYAPNDKPTFSDIWVSDALFLNTPSFANLSQNKMVEAD